MLDRLTDLGFRQRFLSGETLDEHFEHQDILGQVIQISNHSGQISLMRHNSCGRDTALLCPARVQRAEPITRARESCTPLRR